MSKIREANDLLLELFMEGGEEIDDADLGTTLGNVEMLLDDQNQAPNVVLAQKCAHLGRILLLGPDDVESGDVSEAIFDLKEGFNRYWEDTAR